MPTPIRHALGVLAGLCLLGALLLALFDWQTAAILAGSLIAGWLLLVGGGIARSLYRRHRTAFVGTTALVALVLIVVLRPGGGPDEVVERPLGVSSYRAELWPNRLAGDGSFIVRERIVYDASDDAAGAATTSDNRARIEAVRSGPLMHEVRFAAGGGRLLHLANGGAARVVVNPIDDGELHHARGGTAAVLELPMGDVVTVAYDEIPREIRLAYLVGAGRSLAPLAALVTPLRRMPVALLGVLFALIGIALARAWADRLVRPFVGRSERRPEPPGRKPGAPIERAPLVPRR